MSLTTDLTAAQRLGAAIRARRDHLGLSQQRLADDAGLPAAQSVSEIEKGNREVKAWELLKIAGALHTSMDVLLGVEEAPDEPRVLWRRGSRAEDRAREAELLERARRYAQLEEWCNERPTMELPNEDFDPRTTSYAAVSRLAERVRRLLDLGSIPAASLVKTLEESYGVKIFYENLTRTTDGDCSAACVRGDFGAAILVDASEAPWRRNFNFAHELFHLVTWNGVERAWDESAAEGEEPRWYERLESYANHFASHFLLPAESLTARFDARVRGKEVSKHDLAQLAREFEVSVPALLIRLADLGRLTNTQKKQLMRDPAFERINLEVRPKPWPRPNVPFSDRYVELARSAYLRGEVGKSIVAEYLETDLGALADLQMDLPDDVQTPITVA